MAQNPIVTINNVSVYSDKQMSGVSNTRVTFADGSWCDVATGEVVNKGPGYINIGAPATEEEGERITVGPERYATGELDVANIEADIDIQPIDGMGFWRHSGGFTRHAYSANVALMAGGFVFVGYQLAGFFVS